MLVFENDKKKLKKHRVDQLSTSKGHTVTKYMYTDRKCDNDNRSWYKRRYNIVSHKFIWIHRTCDCIWMNINHSVLFSGRVRVRIRFSVCLVSCYAHVFILVSVVNAIRTNLPKSLQETQFRDLRTKIGHTTRSRIVRLWVPTCRR